ncbi:MAG TPA: phosphoglycerate kinase [Candidatus Binatia bacterium]|nr:phosphoglycerate kinase [Candidatus Binatia bacterium]
MALTPIDQLPIAGKHVFVRVDFNVPLNKDGTVSDDTRIREALPTIRYALSQGAKVLLASHLGRPKGKVDPAFSLKPAADRLAALLGTAVKLAPDCVGAAVQEQAAALSAGEVLVLENLRFHAGEEKNEPDFARALAALAEVYVNDAFGSSHRAHASVVGMVRHFASKGIGFLMRKEIDALSRLLANPDRPFVAILGGAKVSDKIGLIRSLLPRVETIIIGGAMAYTLQKAQGIATGKSLVEADKVGEVSAMLAEAARRGVTLLLPKDHIVAAELKPGIPSSTTPGREIPGDQLGVDIGPQSIQAFTAAVRPARTILWNGPMGVFEIPPFDRGTRALAEAVAATASFSVAGGGDTVAALTQAGLADKISHISTGGGASLEFLEAGDLPGLAALREQ